MRDITVLDFLQDGRASIERKNYWAGLSVALLLPSICSRIEYQNKEQNKDGIMYRRENGSWNDKVCYKDWCKDYLKNEWLKDLLTVKKDKNNVKEIQEEPVDVYDEVTNILYALRCDVAHAGHIDIQIKSGQKEIPVSFAINMMTTEFPDRIIIDIEKFCNVIFDHVDVWYTNQKRNDLYHAVIYDGNNPKDQELYDKYCQEARHIN